MTKTAPDPDSFQDEALMIEPEATLRFMLLRTPDGKTYRPFGRSIWVDKATVLGNRYGYGKKHTLDFLDYSEESGLYVSALPPILQRLALPDKPQKTILALTVFLATAELFQEMEQQTDQLPLIPPALPDDFEFPD